MTAFYCKTVAGILSAIMIFAPMSSEAAVRLGETNLSVEGSTASYSAVSKRLFGEGKVSGKVGGFSDSKTFESVLWAGAGAVAGSLGGAVGAAIGAGVGAVVGFIIGKFYAPRPQETPRSAAPVFISSPTER